MKQLILFSIIILAVALIGSSSASAARIIVGTSADLSGTADATQSTLTPASSSITADGVSTQVLTVQAKDSSGNNLITGGSTVTITKQSGTGTVGPVTDNSDGTYTATVTSPTSTGSGVFIAALDGFPVQSGGGSQTQSTITYTAGTLDHFVIAAISSPEVATIPFSINITAQDVNNNTVTSFNGTVNLSANAGTISPSTSGTFSNGLRSESVTLTVAGAGRTMSVDDGSGHTGTSGSFTVNKEPTASALTALPNPSTFEQIVTLKDSVSGSFPDGGKVYFAIDNVIADSASIDSSGVASVAVSTISAGNHSISAFYGGTSNFDTSTSNLVSQVVNQLGPVVALTSNLNPSVFEQNVTFKVTVTNSTHTPTGSVNFYDGATLLGNVALAGDSALISSATLTAGSHTIKGVYSGDSNFKSDSSIVTQVVNKLGPIVTLTSGLNPSVFEQNVTFKVTVTNSSHTPTGSVNFYDGATLLGNVALAGDSALISSATLTAGSHTIKGVYSGDSNFKSDSSSVTQVVNKLGPIVTLTSGLNPSVFEQNVTFKVTVTNSSHTPTGSVNFYDGATLLGNVALAGDSALISSSALTAGSHTIKGVYSGDSNFKSDSSSVTQVVNQLGPVVTLTSSVNPSVYAQNVTFKVTVTNSTHTPTGSVNFYDGATLLGNVALAGDSALISSAALTAGSHNIKAVYSGDSNFRSDSSSVTQVVNKLGPVVTLTSGLNPSVFEQNVTFKVTVTNSSHTPTGSVNFYDGATLLGNVALAGDSALISSATLTAGSHTIKGVYSGDSNFKSDSSSVTQVVNQAGPVVTLTSGLNPSVYAQNVTFKVTVTNSTHTPTGSVNFYDGATLLGNVALVGDSALISSATLTAGSHTIKGVYSGDSNFKSDSSSVTQVVNRSGATVVLVSSLNPSAYGQNVTFKVTVTNSSHTPTGSVNFYDGATLLGNVALSGDSAQISSSALTAGSHTIKGVYSGDSNFKSDSSSVTQVMNQAGPVVTLTSGLNPSVYAQNVTFKVTVTNSTYTPTGSVNFYDGATLLGNVALAGDSALISSATLTAGSHTIKGVYSGDSNFKSDSSNVTQVVNQSGPTVSLVSNLNPSVFEQNVTFKVTVTNSSHTPTGSVNFYDGATPLGNVALSGDSAQISSSALTAGSHTIKGVYSGDSNFKSDSSSVTQVVNQLGPTVSLASSLNPSVYAQNVTFRVTLTNSNHTPTGSVNFYDGATLLGNVVLAGDSAQISSSALTAGSHTIKAVYSGDSNFKSDSSSVTQVVNQAGPIVTLTSGLNPSVFEQSVTFKVTVTNSSHTPTGSVNFYDGATLLGNVALSGDSALISSAALTAGSHIIKAVYSGDSNFKSDSSNVTQVVNQSGPTVSLVSNLNPSVFEQNVTFKVTVTNSSHTPTGSVNFYDGATLLGNVALSGDSALISSAALTAGSHIIKAVYSGDSNFKSDSSNVTQVVNQSGPTVSLVSNLNPSVFEQNVTFKATVTNSTHTPTGSLNFYDGATLLGTVVLAGDSAQISLLTLTAGSHTIKGVYSGDNNFKSDSSSVTQVVNQLGPTVVLASNLNPSTYGQNVTFKATVTNSTHTPTGRLNFYDGATLLGTVVLAGDSAQISLLTLTAGSHTIKGVYSGDNNFKSDSSSVTQVVNQSGATVVLTSSLNPSTYGQNVTFRVTVTKSSVTPTGSVNFYDGATLLSTVVLAGDSASISSAILSAGSHTIQAVYSGDNNFKSDSASVTQVVNQSGSTVVLISSLNPSTYGQNVTFKVTVTKSSVTPTGSVNFYDGATLLSNVVLAGDSALISSATLTAGSHYIRAVYSGDSNFKSDSSSVTQVVNQSGPAIVLTSSLNPSTYGQNIRFKVTVANSTVTATGNVNFYDGATSLGTVVLAGDSALVSSATLTAGSHYIRAVYSGDSNFKSDSSSVTQVVNQSGPAIVLTSSLNPSTYGQNVTFRVTVANSTVTATGNVNFYDGATLLGTVALAGDSALLSSALLTAGSHYIRAVYSGDSNFKSDSSSVTQLVNQSGPAVILTSNLNPSAYGQNITFKMTVTYSSDTPTGSVNFYDGATLLGDVPLSGDSALLSSATLIAGSHTIKAVYSGDNNFKSDSSTVTQVVNQSGSAVVLTSGLNPSTYGQNVTFKVTVANSTVTATGNVTFYDGATLLGNVALAGDSALMSSATLTAGSHTIKAVYSGDSNFKSDSSSVTQIVNQAGPIVTLTSSLNPSVYAQNVTFRVTVTNSSHTPTGSVNFYDGATLLGNVALAGDSALISSATLTAGSHTIKAVYSGDSNFKSDSSTVAQVVNQAGPTVTLTSNLNPSAFAQNVTFKMTVTNSSHTPTGSVNFYDGVTLLGNVALAGDSALISSATLTTGSHTIKAVYSGDSNFKSDSSSVTQVVNQLRPTVVLTSSLNPSMYGQNVTFKVTVTNSSHAPTGSVNFYDGATLLSTAALAGDSAFISNATFTAGSHTIKAVYSGDSNFKSDSSSVTQVVTKKLTIGLLTTSVNPSSFGQTVVLEDSVIGTYPDSGTVQFKDGASNLGSPIVINANGVATFTTSSFAIGTHSVSAVYSGTSNFNGNISDTVSQVVNKQPTISLLVSSLNPSVSGQSVTFKDSVYSSGFPDGGTVQFKDGGTNLGSPVAVNANGVASLSAPALSIGSHNITAVYSGTANFLSSTSNTVVQIVHPKSTAGVLTSSLNPSVFGQSVTFKDSIYSVYTIGPPDGGTVQFKDGTANLGSVVTISSNGVATLTVSNFNAATHAITAVYSGTANFLGSSSNTLNQVVLRKVTKSVLIASSIAINTGQSLTLTDTVKGNPGGGTVQFVDGAEDLGSPVSVDGNGIASYTTSTLSDGAHILSAIYSGTGNFLNSTSNILTVNVNDTLLYRSFRPDSIALSRDDIGELGKLVERKPDKVYFGVIATVLAESANGLHMEFGTVIDTAFPFFTVPQSTKRASDLSLGKWDFTFGNALHLRDTVRIFGYGVKANSQTVTKYYWNEGYTQVSAIQTNPTINPNVLKLPMPNRINAVAEAFLWSGFSSTNGLLVGKARTDSANNYGWILAGQYSDVLQSLSDKTGLQRGAPRGFDFYTSNGKPILGQQRWIFPANQNNRLIADMIALKLNIVLSELGKTHIGFGELIYNDHSPNPLNNLMVKQIAAQGDSLMMGWQVDSAYLKNKKTITVPVHHFADAGVFATLDSTIEKINNAFEGPVDTLRFSDTLIFRGTRGVASVPYLMPNPNVIPVSIEPVLSPQYETPVAYQLYQNYPNPFNPSTTIRFEIPNPSVVTIKIYNILGQEVATLLNNETMNQGTQSLKFNGSNLASGVYFCRIVAMQIADAGNGIPSMEFSSIRKMLLLK